MRWTIGKKLGFGFAAMIALILTVAAVVYVKVGTVSTVQTRVVEDRTPTSLATAGVLNGINDSLANLRGYIILGKDKFKTGRATAWKSIDSWRTAILSTGPSETLNGSHRRRYGSLLREAIPVGTSPESTTVRTTARSSQFT